MERMTAIFSTSHTEDTTVLRLDMPEEVAPDYPAAVQAAKQQAREMQMHFIRLEPTKVS